MVRSNAEKLVLPQVAGRKRGALDKRIFVPFLVASAVLLVSFSKVLFDLAVFAFNTNIHSHILLVPFISGYLIWQQRRSLPLPRRSSGVPPLVSAAVGLLVLLAFFALRFSGTDLSRADYLFFTVFSFACFLLACVIYFLGAAFAKAILFPLAFLFFLAPFPDKVTETLEIASQLASAEAYSWLLDLSGATYFREGRIFLLPNIGAIEVAQECSGIRSSLVLFITSLIAGHMFFRSAWKKMLLALVVFPLGILRNGFRIYVISMLSAHWNPEVIHGPLHSRGGPIFFVLSLVPFFLFLLWLRKTEPKPQRLETH